MLVLTRALPALCLRLTPNIGGPSPEEIAAQKETEEKARALRLWAFGKRKSISDPNREISPRIYPTAV